MTLDDLRSKSLAVTEPLAALASLVRARVSAAQALYEYNNAVDALQWAIGRLVPAEDASTATGGGPKEREQ